MTLATNYFLFYLVGLNGERKRALVFPMTQCDYRRLPSSSSVCDRIVLVSFPDLEK